MIFERNERTIELNTEYRKGIASITKLADIFEIIEHSDQKDVIINLTEYKYIHPSYAAIIAAMPYIGDIYNKKIRIKFNPQNDKSIIFLSNNGILRHFNADKFLRKKTMSSIDFSYITGEGEIGITIEKLLDLWPVNLSPILRAEMYSRIYEIFLNAVTHSKSDRVYYSGSPDTQGTFAFTVYDAGIGIPQNVNNFLKAKISSTDALGWALEKGNSTLNLKVDYPRGLGLSLLESFVNANKGDITIASSDAYCKIAKNRRRIESLPKSLKGTFFSITVRNDTGRRYILSTERR